MTKNQKQKSRAGKSDPVLPREVHIFFNGLFFFSFPNARPGGPPYRREYGTVGILSTRGVLRDHKLFIRFTQAGAPSEPIEIPHSVLNSLQEEIEITRTHLTSAHDVSIRGAENLDIGWGEPPDRNHQENIDHFNWILDFEALHRDNLDETRGSLRPKLKFKTGDFYTSALSEQKYFKRQYTGREELFGYVAAVVGAKITLADDERLVIVANGASIPLPMNVTEIHLNNVRPEHMKELLERETRADADSPRDHEAHGAPHHEHHNDDTQIYYHDLLQGVPATRRFHFRPMNPQQKSPPFICYGSGGSRN